MGHCSDWHIKNNDTHVSQFSVYNDPPMTHLCRGVQGESLQLTSALHDPCVLTHPYLQDPYSILASPPIPYMILVSLTRSLRHHPYLTRSSHPHPYLTQSLPIPYKILASLTLHDPCVPYLIYWSLLFAYFGQIFQNVLSDY